MTNNDQTVTRSGGNVYADLGLPDAEEHQIKAQVVMLIGSVMERHALSQTAAAARMGISQPDLSKVLRGSFRGFTLDRLLACARALSVDFELRAKPSADLDHEGRMRLMVA